MEQIFSFNIKYARVVLNIKCTYACLEDEIVFVSLQVY